MRKKVRSKWPVCLCRGMLIICGALLGVGVYLINANKVVGNRFPMPFGYGAGVVLSGSMEPELSVYDMIIAKETDEFAVGDVVVFQDGKQVVAHRIVALDEKNTTVWTRGDANNAIDPPVAIEDIKGTVIASIPGVGLVINLIKSPVGIITILAAAFILLELSYKKERDQDDEDLEEIRREIKRLKEDKE